MVQDDPKLPDDGGLIPKSQGRGWRFDSCMWNFLSTWRKTSQVVNNLLCFDVGLSIFCLQKTPPEKPMTILDTKFNVIWHLCHYGSFLDDTSYEWVNKYCSWIMDEFIHWLKPCLLLLATCDGNIAKDDRNLDWRVTW